MRLAATASPPIPRASSRPKLTVVEASGTGADEEGPKARNERDRSGRRLDRPGPAPKVPDAALKANSATLLLPVVGDEQVAARVEGQAERVVQAAGEGRARRERAGGGPRPRRERELADGAVVVVCGKEVAGASTARPSSVLADARQRGRGPEGSGRGPRRELGNGVRSFAANRSPCASKARPNGSIRPPPVSVVPVAPKVPGPVAPAANSVMPPPLMLMFAANRSPRASTARPNGAFRLGAENVVAAPKVPGAVPAANSVMVLPKKFAAKRSPRASKCQARRPVQAARERGGRGREGARPRPGEAGDGVGARIGHEQILRLGAGWRGGKAQRDEG